MFKIKSVFIRLLIFILVPTVGWVQEGSPAWRVLNYDSSHEIVPDYQNETNPFPWIEEPLEENITELDYEAIARAEARGLLIQQLRQVIKSGNTYQPIFTNISPRGYLSGSNGAQVMMGGIWRKVNASLQVPISGTSKVLERIQKLKEISPEIGTDFEQKIFKIMPQESQLKVVITDISPTQVKLKDRYGKTYKLVISQQK